MPVKASKKSTEHVFVVTAGGTSAHRHGPFWSREIAAEWVAKHFSGRHCWFIPAEYAGTIEPEALNTDGLRVREG